MILDVLGTVLAILVLIGSLDRLRCINWFTGRAPFVVLYLGCALWALWIMFEAWGAGIQWYQLIGLVAVLGGLIGSRKRWQYGPPSEVTKPTPLGEPELRDSRQ